MYGRSLIKHPSLRRMIPNLANLVEDNNLQIGIIPGELMYGACIMSSSAVNKCRYGNIFPFVRSELDREIQGLSFIVWYAVEIL